MSTKSKNAGIPTAISVDHPGFTVPDLEQAVKFFVEVIGCDLLYTAGPYKDDKSDSMTKALQVDERTSIRLALLRCGPVSNIELVEMIDVGRNTNPSKLSDNSGRHLAIRITDTQLALEYLRKQEDVTILETIRPHDGPETGVETTYIVTPWGMYLELLKRPDKMHYEDTTENRLYKPHVAWEDRPL